MSYEPWKDKKIRKRFLRKIAFCEHGRQCKVCCWPYTTTKPNIYGQFYVSGNHEKGNRVAIRAHVFMYQLVYGEILFRIEDRLFVCHECDNPPCCNYHHLYVGTNLDNVRDAIERGRHVYPPDSVGINNPAHKVTDEDIAYIVQLRQEGYTQQVIADTIGLSRGHVSKILRGKLWGHIDASQDDRNTRYKYSTEQVADVFSLHAEGHTHRAIARIVGMSNTHVYNLLSGRRKA